MKYFLSPKACMGILRRAKAKNKELPKLLETVLVQQGRIAIASTQTIPDLPIVEKQNSEHSAIPYAFQSYSELKASEIGATLKASGGFSSGGSENIVLQKEWTTRESQGYRVTINAKKACTLSANGGGLGAKTGLYLLKYADRYIVRRLTPLECERLQGLPDNWTDFGSDQARYKAIGNGMAQPCADFVIEKLVEVLKERG